MEEFKIITECDAHELALDFAGLEHGRDVTILARCNQDGEFAGWRVELTSDIVVWVSVDGKCEFTK